MVKINILLFYEHGVHQLRTEMLKRTNIKLADYYWINDEASREILHA